jgi:transcriptional regulator with XRE-family HTH domain
MHNDFSATLRKWRTLRKVSQLELALRTGLSQRHLSFVETGRAKPSRECVLQICGALDVPLRDRNVFLNDAGFAALYKESPIPALNLEHARRALELLLRQHEPYPAMVLDPLCNIVMANSGMAALTRLFPVGDEAASPQQPNLIRLMLAPSGMRQYVTGWEHFARRTLDHLRCERTIHPLNAEIEVLEAEFLQGAGQLATVPRQTEPLDILEMENGDLRVRMFSMITTFWPANDITLSELRIELLFPADKPTEEVFQSGAGGL